MYIHVQIYINTLCTYIDTKIHVHTCTCIPTCTYMYIIIHAYYIDRYIDR